MQLSERQRTAVSLLLQCHVFGLTQLIGCGFSGIEHRDIVRAYIDQLEENYQDTCVDCDLPLREPVRGAL